MSDCASQGLSQVFQDFVTDGILGAGLLEVPFPSRDFSCTYEGLEDIGKNSYEPRLKHHAKTLDQSGVTLFDCEWWGSSPGASYFM